MGWVIIRWTLVLAMAVKLSRVFGAQTSKTVDCRDVKTLNHKAFRGGQGGRGERTQECLARWLIRKNIAIVNHKLVLYL
jgi:hypothetical protein